MERQNLAYQQIDSSKDQIWDEIARERADRRNSIIKSNAEIFSRLPEETQVEYLASKNEIIKNYQKISPRLEEVRAKDKEMVFPGLKLVYSRK